jgi:uncharacterized protein RhaS with RHS repeats
MQARFYLPQYGRFASPDPARDQHFENTQSWNIYSYVRNNPIMSTDPTGMEGIGSYNSVTLAMDAGGASASWSNDIEMVHAEELKVQDRAQTKKPIKDKIVQKQVYKNGNKAKTVFGEARGLHPIKGDKASAEQFKKMEIDLAEAGTRGQKHQEADGSSAKEAANAAAWKDALAAALGISDLPASVIHFHMRQQGGMEQHPEYLENSDGDIKVPFRTYGPFQASGAIHKGDKGANTSKTYVDFYTKGATPERED